MSGRAAREKLPRGKPPPIPLRFFGLLCALGLLGAPPVNAQIVFIGSASAGAPAGTLTLTIASPAGTVAGHVMVAAISVRPETSLIAPPAGWTLVRRTDQPAGDANSQALYRKTAGPIEPATYSWTFDTSNGSAGGILTFSGVDGAAPIDVENGQATPNGLTHTTPNVSTTVANTMVVTAHSFSSSASWTPPAGMTEAVDAAALPVPDALGVSLEMDFVSQAATGVTGAKTATAANDTDTGVAQILALGPAPIPTNTPTATSTETPTNSPTATATPTSTPTNTPTATSTSTATPTNTPTITPTLTATPTPSVTPSGLLTFTATPTLTASAPTTPTTTARAPTATLTPIGGGGPAGPASPIPTLSAWLLACFAIALVSVALLLIRRG